MKTIYREHHTGSPDDPDSTICKNVWVDSDTTTERTLNICEKCGWYERITKPGTPHFILK